MRVTSQVEFLWYRVNAQGTSSVPEKVKLIVAYPTPSSWINLGVIWFCWTSTGGSHMKQLNCCHPKSQTQTLETTFHFYSWGLSGICEKQKYVNRCFPACTSRTRVWFVFDTSNDAVSTALHRVIDNNTHRLVFFSMKLSPTQSHNSTFGRELLIIFDALRYFQHIEHGRQVTICNAVFLCEITWLDDLPLRIGLSIHCGYSVLGRPRQYHQ